MARASNAKLRAAAATAYQNAYAPYSHFRVGAAVALDDGSIVTGCNVENASYGLTICAERAAIFAAISAGAKRISCIAVAVEAGSGTSLMPCGACLQVLSEFMAPDGTILLAEEEFELKALVPHSFSLGKT